MVEITRLRAKQLFQLELLKEIDAFCSKNDIKYSLYAGTLLGAVRHKGFIPWDDDVDICLTREEYNRFLNLWYRNGPEDFILINKTTQPTYTQTFTKLRKYGIITYTENGEEKKEEICGFLDVFPIDRIPGGKLKRKLYEFRGFEYILLCREFIPDKANIAEKIISFFVLGPEKPAKREKKRKKLLEKLTKYNTDLSLEMIATEIRKTLKKPLPSDLADGYTSLEFEGGSYMCFSKWDEYLKRKFGDYMSLPPESDRVSTHDKFFTYTPPEKDEKYKVSIIIPVYNGSNYMREAIDSALAQTYSNKEIIVVNDGSSDDGQTDLIAKSYGDRIRYFSKENGGSSSALNCGISHMTGDYFSWLSHDDVYDPDRTEKLVRHIDPARAERQVVICGFDRIDGDGNRIFHPDSLLNGEMDGVKIMKKLRDGLRINGCAVLIPKKVIEEVGGFDEKLIFLNDTDYWYRLIFNGCDFTCFRERLIKTRIHAEQVTKKKADLCKKEGVVLADKIFDTILESDEFKKKYLDIFLVKSAIDGNMDSVRRAKETSGVRTGFITGIRIGFSNLYGKVLAGLKKIYKKLVLKR